MTTASFAPDRVNPPGGPGGAPPLAPDVSETISFPGRDGLLGGAMALGRGPAPRPAVVLIPDVRGVSPLYRELGSDLAAAGFTCLVLDLYTREGTPDLADMAAVDRWIAGLPDARVIADIEDAVRWLGGRADVRPGAVAVLGFCLGGQYATMAACLVPGLGAAVSFYGMLRQATRGSHKLADPLDLVRSLGCPLLGQYGAEDALIPGADVAALRSAAAALSPPVEIHVYDGAGHAFLNRNRADAYRPEAARIAWARARDFLKRHLAT